MVAFGRAAEKRRGFVRIMGVVVVEDPSRTPYPDRFVLETTT